MLISRKKNLITFCYLGVEAQTMTVWRQAQRYQVPCIAFINKLDKTNADLNMTLNSMENKLGKNVLLTQIPLEDPFNGVIDLIHMNSLTFHDKGCEVVKNPIDETHPQYLNATESRDALVEQISEYDDNIANLVIKNDSFDIPSEHIVLALKKIVLDSKALVTFCGSAYKNIGVQPLLDAITEYLPNPNDIKHDFLTNLKSNELCAMAFKIVHHPNKA